MTRPRPRLGYTLLEVLLALAIGLLLMAALYVALDIHLQFTESGREVVQQATLARSIMTRIGNDVTGSLGPPDMGRLNAGSGSGTSTTPAAASPTTPPSTGSGTTTPPSTTSTPQAGTASSSGTNLVMPTFNLMIQGDATHLSVFLSRPPRVRNADATASEGAPGATDLRRISYWLAGTGEALGLAYKEDTLITSDDAQTPAWEVEDESRFVIANEVRSLAFSYFDGSAWQETWDGLSTDSATPAATGGEGTTSTTGSLPKGPPLAIAIVVGFAQPGKDELRQYRHVVAIPTANGIR